MAVVVIHMRRYLLWEVVRGFLPTEAVVWFPPREMPVWGVASCQLLAPWRPREWSWVPVRSKISDDPQGGGRYVPKGAGGTGPMLFFESFFCPGKSVASKCFSTRENTESRNPTGGSRWRTHSWLPKATEPNTGPRDHSKGLSGSRAHRSPPLAPPFLCPPGSGGAFLPGPDSGARADSLLAHQPPPPHPHPRPHPRSKSPAARDPQRPSCASSSGDCR